MRDVGILVWVILVVVGVIGSMISSIRRASQAQPRPGGPAPPRRYAGTQPFSGVVRYAPPPAPPPTAEPSPPAPSPSPPRPQPAARPPVHAAEEVRPKRPRLFAGKGELVRAVIAAEVLGKPRALRDEHFLG